MAGIETRPPVSIRSPLARSMYNKMMEDQSERCRDHSVWYKVNKRQLPDNVCESFVQSYEDNDTKQFLDNCYEKSDWFFTQLFHVLLKTLMSWFISNTTINGVLKRGSMFVFSREQFETLMKMPADQQTQNLLDIGAGDGKVTAQMESHFKNIYVTEMSTSMIWRLQEKGYHVLDIDAWHSQGLQYDVISCLNVLDRCDQPLTLLRNMLKSLTPGSGRAIVATVIPFSPYIEYNSRNHHKPTEYIQVSGKTFEEQVTSLMQEVFLASGFEVESWSRVPYLCEGDLEHSFYYLNDALFVLKPL